MKKSPTTTGLVAGSIMATAVALGAPTAADADANTARAMPRLSAEPESHQLATFVSEWKVSEMDGKSNGSAVEPAAAGEIGR